jgi:hypothetical protein
MHIDSSTFTTPRGKAYTRHLLRESYRQGGKVLKRTLANLSHLEPERIEALRLALAHKGPLCELANLSVEVELRQGPSAAAVLTVLEMARRLGVIEALGGGEEGRRALWQVLARCLEQGSRLSAVRLARRVEADRLLGLRPFDEDDLYENLDWLCAQQRRIEDRLFALRCRERPAPRLFLYDVTSSYLEGVCNELGAFGYNRDGKRGKLQIVVGLLTDDEGWPLSIEVFRGNTQDPATVAAQMTKLSERFGGGEITLVGDRGMLKSREVKNLTTKGMHYITAITRPQIEALLKRGVLQLGLFDQALAEVTEEDGRRYVLHRNPVQAEVCAARRADQLATWQRQVAKTNTYLAEHPRASPRKARQRLAALAKRLKLHAWTRLKLAGRELKPAVDEQAQAEAAKLDGCYALVTDLPPSLASKELVDARYRDLACVEQVFRLAKTVLLEMRPVYVRLESRTRGHALAVMLAYLIARRLADCWRALDQTVEEGLEELKELCVTQVWVRGKLAFSRLPVPRPSTQALLSAAGVELPAALPGRTGPGPDTRRKLPAQRRPRQARKASVDTNGSAAAKP